MDKWKSLLSVAILAVLMLAGTAGCTPDEIQALQATVKNVDSVSGNVTVTLKDGSTRTFNFTDVKVETVRQALGSASLEIGDQLTVRTHKNGDIEELDIKNAELEGTIKSLGTDNVTIATENKGDITLTVTTETEIKIEDKSKAAFSDLQVDQKVEARYDVSTMKALKLEVDKDEDKDEDNDKDNDETGEQYKNREMNISNGQHNDQEMPENTEKGRGKSHGNHK
jgi:hypothetical protein